LLVAPIIVGGAQLLGAARRIVIIGIIVAIAGGITFGAGEAWLTLAWRWLTWIMHNWLSS
jgi:hypothetical protein